MVPICYHPSGGGFEIRVPLLVRASILPSLLSPGFSRNHWDTGDFRHEWQTPVVGVNIVEGQHILARTGQHPRVRCG